MSRGDIPERPRLKNKCRLTWQDRREEYMLMYPEGALVLNETGYNILELVNGERTVQQIIDQLEEDYQAEDLEEEVTAFLRGVAKQGLIADAEQNP